MSAIKEESSESDIVQNKLAIQIEQNQSVENKQDSPENSSELDETDYSSDSSIDRSTSDESDDDEPESKTKICCTFLGCVAFIAVFFSILGLVIFMVNKNFTEGKSVFLKKTNKIKRDIDRYKQR